MVNNNLVKTVVLNRNTTCTGTSDDMVACVTTILQELCELGGVLVSGHLMAYRRPVNLLDNSSKRFRQYDTFKPRVSLSLKRFDIFKPYRHAFEKLF